jgi:hypothetical protein
MTSSSTRPFVSSCSSANQFTSQRFLALADSLIARATSTTRFVEAKEHSFNLCMLKDTLLGRAKLAKCPCCNRRKLVRAGATCEAIEMFDDLIRNLTKDAESRADDCHPGEPGLALSAIRVVGFELRVLIDAATAAAMHLRLRSLAEELRESRDCITCTLILELKTLLLLEVLDRTPTAPNQAAASTRSSRPCRKCVTGAHAEPKAKPSLALQLRNAISVTTAASPAEMMIARLMELSLAISRIKLNR